MKQPPLTHRPGESFQFIVKVQGLAQHRKKSPGVSKWLSSIVLRNMSTAPMRQIRLQPLALPGHLTGSDCREYALPLP